MSLTLDLFLDKAVPFEELVGALATITRTEGGRVDESDDCYEFRVVDVLLMAHAKHSLIADGGIPFDRYPRTISIDRLPPGEHLASYQPMIDKLAVYLAARLSEIFGCEVLVVYELWRVAAAFRSGKAVNTAAALQPTPSKE